MGMFGIIAIFSILDRRFEFNYIGFKPSKFNILNISDRLNITNIIKIINIPTPDIPSVTQFILTKPMETQRNSYRKAITSGPHPN